VGFNPHVKEVSNTNPRCENENNTKDQKLIPVGISNVLILEGSLPLAGGRSAASPTGTQSAKKIEHPGRDASPTDSARLASLQDARNPFAHLSVGRCMRSDHRLLAAISFGIN